MKKYIVLVFLFYVFSAGCLAQDTTITWVSKSGNPIAREMATYLRHSWHEHDSLWQVRDYFPEGNLQMSGSFSDDDLSVKHGNFRYFAENGTKTSEGGYDHNIEVGFWNFW